MPRRSCRSCRVPTNSWSRPRLLLTDIDQVATGATAVVRIMAGNQRTQPEIKGVLTRVSADLAREPQQQNSSQPPPAHYTVRIALPAAEVARLKDIRLLPGYAGRSVHPNPRAHAASVLAQAAARADRAHFS